MLESIREEQEEAFQEGILIGKERFREEIRAEEREKNRKEDRIEIAKNALAKGVSLELIHEITGLDVEVICAIKADSSGH